MRIDIFSSLASEIAKEQSSQKVGTPKTAKPSTAATEDRTTLASDSTSVGSLVSTALASPAVRADKVASLKQAIGSGQYEINPDKIASSMLDESA